MLKFLEIQYWYENCCLKLCWTAPKKISNFNPVNKNSISELYKFFLFIQKIYECGLLYKDIYEDKQVNFVEKNYLDLINKVLELYHDFPEYNVNILREDIVRMANIATYSKNKTQRETFFGQCFVGENELTLDILQTSMEFELIAQSGKNAPSSKYQSNIFLKHLRVRFNMTEWTREKAKMLLDYQDSSWDDWAAEMSTPLSAEFEKFISRVKHKSCFH